MLIELGLLKTVLVKHFFLGVNSSILGEKKYICEEKAQIRHVRHTRLPLCESAVFDQASRVELHTCSAPSGSCDSVSQQRPLRTISVGKAEPGELLEPWLLLDFLLHTASSGFFFCFWVFLQAGVVCLLFQ